MPVPRLLRSTGLGLALALVAASPVVAHEATHEATHEAAEGATHHGALPSAGTEEAAFLAENEAAMTTMMANMAAHPTGDVDRDFVEMMIPHHQGAIDMAVALLRHGRNPQLRRLAQEIIVTQQQEIAAMRLAVGDALPPSTPAPTRAVGRP